MKKILFVAAFISMAVTSFAQKTTPRGAGPGNDNTYRALSINYRVVQDTVGLDTIVVRPNSYNYLVSAPAMLDSMAIRIPSVANAFLGDMLTISVISGAAGTTVRFVDQNVRTTTAIPSRWVIGNSKAGVIVFYFNGVKWVEQSRTITAN